MDALASFGVVHADMPVTLANIWLAMQGPACSEGPARRWFPLNRRGPKSRGAATGRYGPAARAWSLALRSNAPLSEATNTLESTITPKPTSAASVASDSPRARLS